MASEYSFDIVSEVDMAEVKNAFNQATKELQNRYDLKSTKAAIELSDDKIKLTADDEFGLQQVKDIVFSKMIKREIAGNMMQFSDPKEAGNLTVVQELTFKQGIATDAAKALTKEIRDSKIKVKSQIQGDAVRVTGKSKDDLQQTMTLIKGLKLDYSVKFTNYR